MSGELKMHWREADKPVKKRRILEKAASGSKNIRFGEVVLLVEAFGFHQSRIRGSHHIFVHPQLPELLNLQNVDGKAKHYQVRQFLDLVERYNLRLEED